jgi:hypothetical protein
MTFTQLALYDLNILPGDEQEAYLKALTREKVSFLRTLQCRCTSSLHQGKDILTKPSTSLLI